MKARTKVLASFEAGMNLPNLPWHVNITSLKHKRRFGEVPRFRQVEQFNSKMQAFFWQFCFASPKSFRESCVEKYKKFNGVDFSSMRARKKVLASFEAGMNSPKLAVTRKHYVIERQKPIRGIVLLSLKHLSNHGLKVDLYVSFFSR